MSRTKRKEPEAEYSELAHARHLLRGAITLVEFDGNRAAICELMTGVERALDSVLGDLH
jgi:hypothetical protein